MFVVVVVDLLCYVCCVVFSFVVVWFVFCLLACYDCGVCVYGLLFVVSLVLYVLLVFCLFVLFHLFRVCVIVGLFGL